MTPSSSEHTIEVAGRIRTYTLAGPAEPRALVLLFHGSNQTGAAMRPHFDPLIARGARVASLDGYRRNWNDARSATNFPARREGYDDVAFAEAVLDAHGADLPVFVVGYSAGGQLVIRLLHEIPERLAGAAIFSATQPVPEEFAPAKNSAVPRPVLLVHGTKDRLVPYHGGTASLWGFRPRGRGLSAPGTARYYAERNGITAAPKTSGDGPVVRTDYREDGKPPVTLYTVEGGGHVIPGPVKMARVLGRATRDLVAADAVAEFFGIPQPV
ncbi:alpha/beta hydrolase family esterase [Amycolatopsis sacchari]|uniref:alpha/beta hydrolase family esterase n=1 Tax=Amycolatopsis sacchari TaxID=115433 RepID=UPI003D751682